MSDTDLIGPVDTAKPKGDTPGKPDSFASIDPARPGHTIVSGAPEGADTLFLDRLVERVVSAELECAVFVARDEERMLNAAQRLSFVAPKVEAILMPAWDCLPYDRVSPNADAIAQRLTAMTRLATGVQPGSVVFTTVNAALQRLPPRAAFKDAALAARPGDRLDLETLTHFFQRNGYRRATTVREPGEFAIRGGILDVYPPGEGDPLRLDFFGDELETIRRFDAMSQRTTGDANEFVLQPVSEIILDTESIDRFRQSYRELFGADMSGDPIYDAVSEGRRPSGMEHWLPLFHDHMETLFDWLGPAPVVLDAQVDEAAHARFDAIADYFEARREDLEIATRRKGGEEGEGPPIYRPLAPDRLYLTDKEWQSALAERADFALNPFNAADPDRTAEGPRHFDMAARRVVDFAEARTSGASIFHAVADRIRASDRPVLIAAHSDGARERLKLLLAEGGMENVPSVVSWSDYRKLAPGAAATTVLQLEHGFETDEAVVWSEQDILGERLARPAKRRRRRGEEFITELSALEVGDLVVHVEHGIGRYEGLETIRVEGAPHDCLQLIYHGGSKLYLPVENLEVLSRYGSEDTGVQLDRLGGAAWQARKAKLKERVKEIADQLIKTAAARALRKGETVHPPEGAYDEFCARFAFAETDDQLRAIGDVAEDLASGRPMDRLVCGDVGFGKTEVALRAAFMTAMSGMQVAVVVPTTLLARQHHKLFQERFDGLPVRIAQLSRFVTAKEASLIKEELAAGKIDIVVGTHALLAKSVKIPNLGLMIVDEEQHFGVQQKEKLKQLRANVHVLTLTATPIPRTLQMALAGVREMSIIATPPVDRLAVRTFVLPFDPVVLREAIRRERYRGGQIFYVCPRLADLDRVRERLRDIVPNATVAMAHGRMGSAELEQVMTDFVDGKYDILLSTNIVESGLDIPNANTMIVHRADMFGLSQLYQLRGRIGRSKQRAYCYLTLPPGRVLSQSARKRLDVMQTLDSLGAGFTLASHDLDIRGAGNLVGEEQSGHIREVGIELYQRMLEEAVSAARDHTEIEGVEETWSPTINVGIAVLIPENYVQDLSVRLSLYRRLSDLTDAREIDAFAVELVDRFGKLPQEVENLMEVVQIKQLCKRAGIEKFDAGAKGGTVTFRNNNFVNPQGLIGFIQKMAGSVKLRPDHKLVAIRPWQDTSKRLKGVKRIAEELAKIAG